jgi:hypothetical protein
MSTTMTPAEITARLDQHYGSENWYRHPFGRLTFTDGVKDMAEMCGAWWLIDLIASHQTEAVRQACDGYQFWTIEVKNGKFTATCRRDSGDLPIVTQEGDTDFPLEKIALWVGDGGPDGNPVLMLPSEY